MIRYAMIAAAAVFSQASFGDISVPRVSNDASYVYYSYTGTARYTYHQVFIDTDLNDSTGYSYNGLGADYLIENDSLYQHVGPGWAWKFIKKVNFRWVDSEKKFRWSTLKADIGETKCPESMKLFFREADDAGYQATSSILNFNFTCTPTDPPPPTSGMKMAIPTYFYATSNYWNQLQSPQVGVSIINPNNGPGNTIDQNYVNQTKATQAKGIMVLGYVATGYGNNSLTTVKQQVDQYYNWYKVDGIFFDEAANNCTLSSYYANINAHVKSKGGKAFTIINPGATTPECFYPTADVIVNFESDAGAYTNWKPMGWESKYPASHFWHLVYAAQESQIPTIVSKAKSQNAGWIYVTPDNLPNPWDTLPTGTYWQKLLDLLKP